jgi:LPXTG-motif cell wall-anchored protein
VSARRPLLTAIGAGTLLAALWFVPSANATTDRAGSAPQGRAVLSAPGPEPAAQQVSLADTGSADTTPYLLGGMLCLGIGAGFVTFSATRRQGS